MDTANQFSEFTDRFCFSGSACCITCENGLTDACFSALHFDTTANGKRVKLFWIAFTGMFFYEVLPAYIFPLLNGISVFCLASQNASSRVVDIFTNLFGGTNGNEGLGFLNVSFDWQYIGSSYVLSLSYIHKYN